MARQGHEGKDNAAARADRGSLDSGCGAARTERDVPKCVEARSLFDAAAALRDFWAVEGAAHVNLHRFAQGEYERRVSSFLATYMTPR